MVFYLMIKPGNNLESIATYFTLAATSRNDDRNFQQAFGVSLAEFLPAFETWLAGLLAESAKIEVIGEGGEHTAKIQKIAEASQHYFRDNFGTSLRSNVRFVVAADRTAYTAAMVKQFGVDAQEAEKRAKSSSWWFSNSTTVVNIGAFSSEGDMACLLADNLALRLANEAASQPLLEAVYWLYYGGAPIIGLRIAEGLGYANVREYPARWRADLRGRRPALAEITGKKAWEQATAEYGRATVQRTARLATLFFVEKHGVQSLYRWYLRTKETQNAAQAFADIFGLPPGALEKDFTDYLNNKEQASLPAPFLCRPAA